jgi:hypothetical protein
MPQASRHTKWQPSARQTNDRKAHSLQVDLSGDPNNKGKFQPGNINTATWRRL